MKKFAKPGCLTMSLRIPPAGGVKQSRRLRGFVRSDLKEDCFVAGAPRNDTMELLGKHKPGFTLIEIIMTMVVAGIVCIPLALMVNQHVQSVAQLEDYTLALNLARLDIETVNNTAYNSISSSSYTSGIYTITRSVSFAQGTAVSAESLKQINVSAAKTGSSNNLFSLVTYIAKNVSYGL